MQEKHKNESVTVFQASEIVRDAWYSGRTIVPVVGAGMSVNSGVPSLSEIIRYLSLLNDYITRQGFVPQSFRHPEPESSWGRILSGYSISRGSYVEDFGWPDRFDLEFNVGLDREERSVFQTIRKNRVSLISELYQGEDSAIKTLLSFVNESADREKADESLSLLLDWRRLTHLFTGYKRQLADSLFSAIHSQREPGIAQTHLIELVKLFGSTTIFTFNFDPLIEDSLNAAEMRHQVFAMEHGKSLPAKILVDRLSVIKMHGSTHNLLVDEQLDRPLSESYKQSFVELVGPNPLLLIIGCSGADRRLRDLVDVATSTSKGNASVLWTAFSGSLNAPISRAGKPHPDVRHLRIRDAGLFLSHLYTQLTGRLPTTRDKYISYPMHYFKSVSVASGKGHSFGVDWNIILKERCVLITSIPNKKLTQPSEDTLKLKPVHDYLLQCIESLWTDLQQVYVDVECAYTVSGVVAEIVDQVKQFDKGTSTLVWHENTEDIAPEGGSSPTRGAEPQAERSQRRLVRASVRRIVKLLNSSKVCLVLDGIEGFVYRPNNHHGVVDYPRQDVGLFFDFLVELINSFEATSNGNGSKIILTADPLQSRRNILGAEFVSDSEKSFDEVRLSQFLNSEAHFYENMARLFAATSCVVQTQAVKADAQPPEVTSAFRDAIESSPTSSTLYPGLFFRFVCSIRRNRSEAMLREVLRVLKPEETDNYSNMTKILESLAQDSILVPLEGGYYSIDRSWRNMFYRLATSATGSKVMRSTVNDLVSVSPLLSPDAYEVAEQLALQTAVHSTLGMIYYDKIFASSNDVAALLESSYHNFSAYRFSTDLKLLLCLSEEKLGDSLNAFMSKIERDVCNRSRADCNLFDIFGDPVVKTASGFKRASTARQRLMRRMTRNWQRHQSVLTMSATPESLGSVCRAVRNDMGKYRSLTARFESLFRASSSKKANQLTKMQESLREMLDDEDKGKHAEGDHWRNTLECDFIEKVRATEIKSLVTAGDAMQAVEILLESENGIKLKAKLGKKLFKSDDWAGPKTLNVAFVKNLANAVEKWLSSENIDAEMRSVCIDLLTCVFHALEANGLCSANERNFDISANEISRSAKQMRTSVMAELLSSRPGEASSLEDYVRSLKLEVESVLMPRSPGMESIRKAISACQSAIQVLHDAPSVQRPVGKDNVVSLPEASGLLMPYRSVLRILLGRLYAKELKIDKDISVNSDSSTPYSERIQGDDVSGFLPVFREFQFAKNGLLENNPTLKALCEIHSTATALDSVDKLLMDGPPGLNAARSKLTGARGYLDASQHWVYAGSNNVEAWRLLSCCQLRFASRNIVCRISELTQSPPSGNREKMKEYGMLDASLRKSLKAARDGLDYTPISARRQHSLLFSEWHGLMAACCAFFSIVAKDWFEHKQPGDTSSSVPDLFREYWTYVNVREDLKINEKPSSWISMAKDFHEKISGLAAASDSGRSVLDTIVLNESLVDQHWQNFQESWMDL